jgi:hypothetical protein
LQVLRVIAAGLAVEFGAHSAPPRGLARRWQSDGPARIPPTTCRSPSRTPVRRRGAPARQPGAWPRPWRQVHRRRLGADRCLAPPCVPAPWPGFVLGQGSADHACRWCSVVSVRHVPDAILEQVDARTGWCDLHAKAGRSASHRKASRGPAFIASTARFVIVPVAMCLPSVAQQSHLAMV